MSRSLSGPAYWPMDLYGDDGWSLRVEMTDADEEVIDCTGRTYRAQVRSTAAAAGDPLCELDIDASDAANGVIVVSVPQDEVRGLAGWWDFQEIIGSSPPITLFAGPVNWASDVTR